jgi:hypothetical protein
MKRNLIIILWLCFLCLSLLVIAQDNNLKVNELKVLVKETIMKKCFLTELSQKKEIRIDNNEIIIEINFYNESLMSFWSPEVAVQYIFDAALYNITNAIWNNDKNEYRNFNKIKFNVDIRPHDIPPLITFEITLTDWNSYENGGNKENLYKNMLVTAEGKPFLFDAHTAKDIE